MSLKIQRTKTVVSIKKVRKLLEIHIFIITPQMYYNIFELNFSCSFLCVSLNYCNCNETAVRILMIYQLFFLFLINVCIYLKLLLII